MICLIWGFLFLCFFLLCHNQQKIRQDRSNHMWNEKGASLQILWIIIKILTGKFEEVYENK